MDKNEISAPFRKLFLLDVAENLASWNSVPRNKWLIKFSIYRGNILIVVRSIVTAQTFVRYFSNEKDACDFVNLILSKPAEEILNFV